MQFIALSALFAGMALATPIAQPNALQARGQCGLHVKLRGGSYGITEFDLTVKDASGNVIGTYTPPENHAVSDWQDFTFQHGSKGSLASVLSVTHQKSSNLPHFSYNGHAWDSSSSACSVGKEDVKIGGGTSQDLDCGFAC